MHNSPGNADRDPTKSSYSALLLFTMTILSQMVSLAFGRLDAEQSFSQIVLPSLIFLSLITVPACYFGVTLGRQIGLGVTQLDELLTRQPGAMLTLRRDIVLATLLGVAVGIALLLLRLVTESFLPAELPQLGFRGVIGGLAVSLGAAVAEEVWFRLGLMTVLVWAITRLQKGKHASSAVIWAVIVFSAIIFAAAHLPQLITYGAGSYVGVLATLFGNVVVGVLYGWLFWRRGILAAMVSHFSVDLVLHVMSVWIW